MKHQFLNRRMMTILLAILVLVPSMEEGHAQQSVSSSLGVIVYPTKGQSPEQQNKDEGECYDWAKQQTGTDPMTAARAPATPEGEQAGGRERLKGGAGGAAAGAAIGSLSGDMGEGAAIGAIAGTMLGGRKARQNKAAREEQAQQAQASTRQHFNKAFGVCMEAREYSVR